MFYMKKLLPLLIIGVIVYLFSACTFFAKGSTGNKVQTTTTTLVNDSLHKIINSLKSN